MYQARVMFDNTLEGKKRAIKHLQYTLEDSRPWYLNCPYRTAGMEIGDFNNWLILDTFDMACFAIKNATRDIIFYQMEPTVLSDKEVNTHMQLTEKMP